MGPEGERATCFFCEEVCLKSGNKNMYLDVGKKHVSSGLLTICVA